MECDCPACGAHCIHTEDGGLKCPDCGHVVSYNPLHLDELKRRYPHAANNITEEGLLRADKTTLETWEFEGEICDSVMSSIGSVACPRCTFRVWRIGETIVNFYFPFTHSMRVHAYGLLGKRVAKSVTCVTCGLRRRLKK